LRHETAALTQADMTRQHEIAMLKLERQDAQPVRRPYNTNFLHGIDALWLLEGVQRFQRPLVTGFCFLIALPMLGFAPSKAMFIAAVVVFASAFHFGRRTLQVAAAAALLYAIPTMLEIAPPPLAIMTFIKGQMYSFRNPSDNSHGVAGLMR
jgi:hypothetical protein